jgi:hypothetical protein
MGSVCKANAKTHNDKSASSISQSRNSGCCKSANSPTEKIMFLQRTAGNQAVQRLIKSRALQAKLRIGQTNDIYEQEADRVAEQVMRMPDPVIERRCAMCDEDEKKVLQTKESPGQPLDSATRAFMETRFGHDFSGVRVHTDSKAAESTRAVNALAYTVGMDVMFGEGQHAPDTGVGRRLIAHELTHVVQQSHGGICSDLDLGVQHDKSDEADASKAAQSQILVSVRGKTPVKIARQSMDPRHARGYGGEQSMGFGYSQEKGWILVEGPSGAAGHGVTTKGFDGVAYNINADELHLIDNKSLKAETASSATAITKNLKKNLDALIQKVAGIHDIPKKSRILQLLKEMRNNIALGKKIPENTKLIVTGEGGRVKFVSPSLKKQGVEFRKSGMTDLPPAGKGASKPPSTPAAPKPLPTPTTAPGKKTQPSPTKQPPAGGSEGLKAEIGTPNMRGLQVSGPSARGEAIGAGINLAFMGANFVLNLINDQIQKRRVNEALNRIEPLLRTQRQQNPELGILLIFYYSQYQAPEESLIRPGAVFGHIECYTGNTPDEARVRWFNTPSIRQGFGQNIKEFTQQVWIPPLVIQRR